MGWTFGTNGSEEKSNQGFGRKTWRKETTCKSLA